MVLVQIQSFQIYPWSCPLASSVTLTLFLFSFHPEIWRVVYTGFPFFVHLYLILSPVEFSFQGALAGVTSNLTIVKYNVFFWVLIWLNLSALFHTGCSCPFFLVRTSYGFFLLSDHILLVNFVGHFICSHLKHWYLYILYFWASVPFIYMFFSSKLIYSYGFSYYLWDLIPSLDLYLNFPEVLQIQYV